MTKRQVNSNSFQVLTCSTGHYWALVWFMITFLNHLFIPLCIYGVLPINTVTEICKKETVGQAIKHKYVLVEHLLILAVTNSKSQGINTRYRWMKGCILPFPKKGDLELAKNYLGITLTSIAAKIYNALLRNCIVPKIDNILRKNRRNRSTTSQILTICRIFEGVWVKKTTGDNTICWLYQGLWFHSQREDGTNSTSLRHTKRDHRGNNDSL